MWMSALTGAIHQVYHRRMAWPVLVIPFFLLVVVYHLSYYIVDECLNGCYSPGLPSAYGVACSCYSFFLLVVVYISFVILQCG